MTKAIADYDAIVIGAGFSGIRSLWEFGQLGLTVKCFDAALDVGGTWYWNRYPGSRTDGEADVYVLNFAPELLEEWNFHERYPSQQEIQDYLGRIVDRYDLRKHIEFGTYIAAAHYSDDDHIWTITTANGLKTTCRYFIPATGILSVPKVLDFPGLKSYTGEVYQASNWPTHKIDFENKRIAVVGTGSTGVHIIPKIAHVAKELTVFQRTPNYVVPGRNHTIDEYQATEIKKNYDANWELASQNIAGHPFRSSGRVVKGSTPDQIRQVLDNGWEKGCFNFQLETFDDTFMDPESNEVVAEFIRQKIRAIVLDPKTAELLCPRYALGAKRPPSGHHYYEAFNRSNVELVDISQEDIELYEKGVRTSSGTEYEFDMVIFAVGFDAGTGALTQMDVRGSKDKSLRDYWHEKLETFAGVLVPGFPNMFMVCGPHMPAGNQPTFLEPAVQWISKTICHMETNKYATINVSQKAAEAWTDHVEALWNFVFISKPAAENRSWYVGTNIPGKPTKIMFYFGGLPNWRSWLDNETATAWSDMEFTSLKGADKAAEGNALHSSLLGELPITAEILESVVTPLQSDQAGLSPEEKFNICSAACARYIDWAVKAVHDGGLAVKQDYRVHWWKTLVDFAGSESGRALIEQSPDTKEELDELTSQLGVEGEAIARIGPELVRLLTGETNPLQHILKDDLLFRIYSADEGTRPNRYVADLAKMLTSQKKDLRILEIGAGTGGTTRQVLQACSPDGEPFCKEYVYTDISAAFFKTGESSLKKWAPLLTFKTLDIETDAAKQGFEEHAYDLIITANCIHATHSLNRSLGNIHKLLKPGGVLALVELTRLTPYFNIAFGPLEGWWAGVGEGRIESPLLSAEQWNEQLKNASFSGVDLAAFDLPEPERHSALLLSTALATNTTTHGQATTAPVI